MSPQKFLVGDRVKWTGHANGGSVEHEGVIKKIYRAGEPGQQFDQAQVEVSSVNKRTGKPNAVKVYMPRMSALTLVQGRVSSVLLVFRAEKHQV